MATLSAKEAARELGTDARTFRKFMRAITPKEDQPGQGNRYSIEARQINKLKKQFDEWNKPKTKPAEVTDEVIEDELLEIETDEMPADDEELEDADEVEDEGPTDEELEALAEDFDIEDLEELEELA